MESPLADWIEEAGLASTTGNEHHRLCYLNLGVFPYDLVTGKVPMFKVHLRTDLSDLADSKLKCVT